MNKFIKIISPIFLIALLSIVSGCTKKTDVRIDDGGLIEGQDEVVQDEPGEEVDDEEEVTQEIEELPKEVITSDIDTSDWLTYRNEEYGFEVKYPSSYFVRDNNKYIEQRPGVLGMIYFKTDNSNFNDFGITVGTFYMPENGLDYDDMLKKQNDAYNKFNKYNALINNENVIQFKQSKQMIWTYIEKGDIYYNITFLSAGVIDPDIYDGFLLNFKTIE